MGLYFCISVTLIKEHFSYKITFCVSLYYWYIYDILLFLWVTLRVKTFNNTHHSFDNICHLLFGKLTYIEKYIRKSFFHNTLRGLELTTFRHT